MLLCNAGTHAGHGDCESFHVMLFDILCFCVTIGTVLGPVIGSFIMLGEPRLSFLDEAVKLTNVTRLGEGRLRGNESPVSSKSFGTVSRTTHVNTCTTQERD
jgi:hypothetical protein